MKVEYTVCQCNINNKKKSLLNNSVNILKTKKNTSKYKIIAKQLIFILKSSLNMSMNIAPVKHFRM